MPRFSVACLVALSLGPAACTTSDAPPVIPPPAEVSAPARLTQPDVPEPPAPAPTAKGTYVSMSPPSTQHTPPRPRTTVAAPSADSLAAQVRPAP